MVKKKKLRMRKENLILFVLLGLGLLFLAMNIFPAEEIAPAEEDYQTLWNFEGSIVGVDNKWLETLEINSDSILVDVDGTQEIIGYSIQEVNGVKLRVESINYTGTSSTSDMKLAIYTSNKICSDIQYYLSEFDTLITHGKQISLDGFFINTYGLKSVSVQVEDYDEQYADYWNGTHWWGYPPINLQKISLVEGESGIVSGLNINASKLFWPDTVSPIHSATLDIRTCDFYY
jgi:hypothetical protein